MVGKEPIPWIEMEGWSKSFGQKRLLIHPKGWIVWNKNFPQNYGTHLSANGLLFKQETHTYIDSK